MPIHSRGATGPRRAGSATQPYLICKRLRTPSEGDWIGTRGPLNSAVLVPVGRLAGRRYRLSRQVLKKAKEGHS